MNFKILFLSMVVFLGVCDVNGMSPSTLHIRNLAEDALKEQMLRSRSGPMQKSDNSACYDYYSEVQKNLIKKLESDTKLCKNTETEKLVEASNEGQQSRDTTTKTLKNICETINGCIENSVNLDFFDCVDRSGDANTRGIWTASRDSSEIAADIRNKIDVIKHETVVCTDQAERAYEKGTYKATQDMVACYASGGITSTPENPLTQDE